MVIIWKGSLPKLIKADLHIHSEYSMDCTTKLDEIIERCQKLKLDCIAIADHGTAEGALKLKKIAPFYVIVAEEVLTPHGEIMGMFLTESIPSGISVDETIAAIRSQGGLVCIPHPFDVIRGSALDNKEIERLASMGEIDVMEALNARSILGRDQRLALDFSAKHKITRGAGSDAHSATEIGRAYMEMPEFKGKEDFLQALAQGRICGQRTNPLAHFRSLSQRLKKKYL